MFNDDYTDLPPGGNEVQHLDQGVAFVLWAKTGDNILGTAFVAHKSEQNVYLVTCRHVIEKTRLNQLEIGAEVYLEFVHRAYPVHRTARIYRYLEDSQDDIVILELTLDEELHDLSVLIVASAEKSLNRSSSHRFKSYGYRPVEETRGMVADGEIHSYPQADELDIDGEIVGLARLEFQTRASHFLIKSQHVAPGMSGAPILDVKRNLVVGIVKSTVISKTHDRDTAIAIDCAILQELLPDDFELHPHDNLTLTESQLLRQQQRNQSVVSAPSDALKISIYHEPTPGVRRGSYIVRSSMITDLDTDWQDESIHITGVVGFAGNGKSAMARAWVEKIIQAPPDDLRGIFWWDFSGNPDVAALIDELLRFLLTKQQYKEQVAGQFVNKLQIIGDIIQQKRILLVLDNLHQIQNGQLPDKPAQLAEGSPIRTLLEYFALRNHDSYCLVISRQPLVDFFFHVTYRQRYVESLSNEDSLNLLRSLGVEDSDERCLAAAKRWNGHALSLILLAGIRDEHGNLPDIETIPALGNSINNVIAHYDSLLGIGSAEQILLQIVSIFEYPIPKQAMHFVINGGSGFVHPLRVGDRVDQTELERVVKRLLQCNMIQHVRSGKINEFSVHPLVGAYYRDMFNKQPARVRQALHVDIARYWFFRARLGDTTHQVHRRYLTAGMRHLMLDIRNPDKAIAKDIIDYVNDPAPRRIPKLPKSEFIIDRRYIRVSQLGKGAQGSVWFGFDLNTMRQVAIKQLNPAPNDDNPENQLNIVERIQRNFTLLFNLSNRDGHPHVVELVDLIPPEEDDPANSYYIIMKRYVGGTLDHEIKKRTQQHIQFHPLEVAELLGKLADALDYVHNNGIIHRDIKPSNILFEDGTLNHPRIVDFGLARALTSDVRTLTDGVVGTLLYMSPEQLQGNREKLSGKCDQYALAYIVYQLLAGHHPFKDSSDRLFVNHLHVMPEPIHKLRPDLPEAISNVLAKAMDKEPDDRFPTLKHFAQAFSDALGTAGSRIPLPEDGGVLRTQYASDEDPQTVLMTSNTSSDELKEIDSKPVDKNFSTELSIADAPLDDQTEIDSDPADKSFTPLPDIETDLKTMRPTAADAPKLADEKSPALHPNPEDIVGSMREGIKFSAYHPQQVKFKREYKALVYVHLPSLSDEVQQEAQQSFEDENYEARESDQIYFPISTRTQIEIEILHNPYLLINEASRNLKALWNGKKNRFEILFSVASAPPFNETVLDIQIRSDGFPIRRIACPLQITEDDTPSERTPSAGHILEPDRKLFLVYSRKDKDWVDDYKKKYAAHPMVDGDELSFSEITSISPDKHWERNLAFELDKTDRFYLFWSQNAFDDAVIKKSWKRAKQRCHNEDRCDFIYIEHIKSPVPALPVPLQRVKPHQYPPDVQFVKTRDRNWFMRLAITAIILFVVAGVVTARFRQDPSLTEITEELTSEINATDTVSATATESASSTHTEDNTINLTETISTQTDLTALAGEEAVNASATALMDEIASNNAMASASAVQRNNTATAISLNNQSEIENRNNTTTAIYQSNQTATQNANVTATAIHHANQTATQNAIETAGALPPLPEILENLLNDSYGNRQFTFGYDCTSFNSAYEDLRTYMEQNDFSVSEELLQSGDEIVDSCMDCDQSGDGICTMDIAINLQRSFEAQVEDINP